MMQFYRASRFVDKRNFTHLRALLKEAKDIPALVDQYSRFPPASVSLKQLLDFGRVNPCMKTSFMFLNEQLPIRLANILQELKNVPCNLIEMPSVQIVQSWYFKSFEELMEFIDKNPEDPIVVKEFTKQLNHIRDRHTNVVETMAKGVIELRKRDGTSSYSKYSSLVVDEFLHRFYVMRIAIRMLINQHILLFGDSQDERHPRQIGSIDPNCDIKSIIFEAFNDAAYLCDAYYSHSPELKLEMKDCISKQDDTEKLEIAYVPSHLYYILFELFKNSMRAVVEFKNSEILPKIEVFVSKGKEDLTIRVSDKGGGFPRSQLEQLFSFMFTTAKTPPQHNNIYTSLPPPMAGYGYGLPISRVYARYFQGDLQLASMEGYGTDAYVHLKALSEKANEQLPNFTDGILQHYKAQQIADKRWC